VEKGAKQAQIPVVVAETTRDDTEGTPRKSKKRRKWNIEKGETRPKNFLMGRIKPLRPKAKKEKSALGRDPQFQGGSGKGKKGEQRKEKKNPSWAGGQRGGNIAKAETSPHISGDDTTTSKVWRGRVWGCMMAKHVGKRKKNP